MRIYVIYTSGGPFKAYLNGRKALGEYKRLRNLDDYVEYSFINMPVDEETPIKEGEGEVMPCDYANPSITIRGGNNNPGKW